MSIRQRLKLQKNLRFFQAEQVSGKRSNGLGSDVSHWVGDHQRQDRFVSKHVFEDRAFGAHRGSSRFRIQ